MGIAGSNQSNDFKTRKFQVANLICKFKSMKCFPERSTIDPNLCRLVLATSNFTDE